MYNMYTMVFIFILLIQYKDAKQEERPLNVSKCWTILDKHITKDKFIIK